MTALVEHFDHFVMPVEDILDAEEFYVNVLGGKVAINRRGRQARAGLNVRYYREGVRPLTFFSLAGKRIGTYLQSDFRSPRKPENLQGALTYTFETRKEFFSIILERFQETATPFLGPFNNPMLGVEKAIYFNDPTGNHLAIYIPTKPNATTMKDPAPPGGLTAVGYIQLEAPDLHHSIRFYRETFGLEKPTMGANAFSSASEARFVMPSGQLLVLTEAPFSDKGMKYSRLEPGPHFGFYVPDERWHAAMDNITRLGIPNGDRAADAKARPPEQKDTYLDDPAGYVIQLLAILEE